MSPRLAAHYSAIYLDRRLFDRIDRLHGERAALGLAPEQHAPARARAPRFRSRRRAAVGDGEGALRGDRRAPRDAFDAIQPERSRRRSELPIGAVDRARSRRPARRAARGGAQRGAGARPAGRVGDHAVALADRAVPHVLRPARSARAGVQCVDPSRRECRRPRQSSDRPRNPRAAQRAGAAARLRELRRIRAGRPDGRQARRRSRSSSAKCGSRPRRARRQSATRWRRWRSRTAKRTRSSPGTGATTRRRCARRATDSTKRR